MSLFKHEINRNQKGMSLLEVLLALAILSVVAIYLSRMVAFVESGNKVDQTFDRMEKITRHIKVYYLSHETVPSPAETPPDSVPVDDGLFNLPQKYRFDAWGQYFFYDTTDTIVGCKVNGHNAAGVLISLGANQVKDYTVTDSNVYTGGGDDLLVPITVEEEAWQIVMAELDVLEKRVMAYDRIFAGINNNKLFDIYDPSLFVGPPPGCDDLYPNPTNLESYRLVDETGCVKATGSGEDCSFTVTEMDNEGGNDPNCGRASIDECLTKEGLENFLVLYGLGANDSRSESFRYYSDPWGNSYQWGDSTIFSPDNRRYHVFYSMGPDRIINSKDDMTPY